MSAKTTVDENCAKILEYVNCLQDEELKVLGKWFNGVRASTSVTIGYLVPLRKCLEGDVREKFERFGKSVDILTRCHLMDEADLAPGFYDGLDLVVRARIGVEFENGQNEVKADVIRDLWLDLTSLVEFARKNEESLALLRSLADFWDGDARSLCETAQALWLQQSATDATI